MTPAILARGLTKRFGSTIAVDGLDLGVEPGQLYGLVGPNGAGKSTAIRMLLGLIRPTSGEAQLLGEPPGPGVLSMVGAIVEDPAFWGFLSGRRNLEAFARAGDRDDARRRLARIDGALARAGLAHAAGKKVRTYSRGMRQRLGIALALLGDPRVVVMDEPTSGLDHRGATDTHGLLASLRDQGRAVLITSHALSDIGSVCDHVGVMLDGRLVAEGSPAELEVDDARR